MTMEKKNYLIKLLKNNELSEIEDPIVTEYPLSIFINNEEFITLLCTPKDLKELVYGFLYSEGLIHHQADVKDLYLDEKNGTARVSIKKDLKLFKELKGRRVKTTGCGNNSLFYDVLDEIRAEQVVSDFKILADTLLEMSRELNKLSPLFLETGGVHSTMLIDSNRPIVFYEDVGRHNTVDKIVGYALFNGIDMSQTALFTSGRISSEMLIKTLKAKVPMIISRSAPTDLAVNLAKVYGITLIGFVRGERMNIYNDPGRLLY